MQRSSEGSFKIHKDLTKILIGSYFLLLACKMLKRSLQGYSKIHQYKMRVRQRSLIFWVLHLSAIRLVLHRHRQRANVTKACCLRFEWWVSLSYMEILPIVGFCRHFENKQELQYTTYSRRSIQKGIYVLVAEPFLHYFASLAVSSYYLQDQEFR